MDEIDNIILHSLKQIGCNIDEECNSLNKFTPELIVESVSKCITLINPNIEVPKSLGAGMAQRFGVSTTLAEVCKTLGFRGDIGYQTFLYSNTTEVRRVFMYLIERIPKETEKIPLAQPLDKVSALEHEIFSNITSQLKASWIPHVVATLSCNKSKTQTTSNVNFSPEYLYCAYVKENNTITDDMRQYLMAQSPTIFQQTDSNNLIPSIVHTNDKIQIKSNSNNLKLSIGKILNYNLIISPSTQYVEHIDTVVSLKQSIDNSKIISKQNIDSQPITNPQTPLEILKSEILILERNIEDKSAEQLKLVATKGKLLKKSVEMEQEIAKMNEEKRLKERTHLLLQDPEVNIQKLKSIALATEERMKKLSTQWDDHRSTLEQTLETSNESQLKQFSKTKEIQDQIQYVKLKCIEMADNINVKATIYKQLAQEYEKINKNINRNAYTSRISEIIGNITKQKLDIDKILKDTRELQKEINIKTGQLDRQFTVTDDLIFKSAKNDGYSKKSYKLLASLHSDCNELIALVQTTGSLAREVRDLGEQIENQRKCNVSSNLERIALDLEQMRVESATFKQKIQEYEIL